MKTFLRFEEVQVPTPVKKLWRVYNKNEKEDIACISWYPKWRKYVVSFRESCPFDSNCLQEIIEFLNTQNGK